MVSKKLKIAIKLGDEPDRDLQFFANHRSLLLGLG